MRSTIKKMLVTASATGVLLAGGAGIASAASGPALPEVSGLPSLTAQCVSNSLSHTASDPLGSLLAGVQNPVAGARETLACVSSLLGGGLPGLSQLPALPQLPGLSGLSGSTLPGIGS